MFHCRDVCLIAHDPLYSTTACVTLYYIGTNSNPPTVTYDAEDVAIFVEGQSEPVRIVEGNVTVHDPDHPIRYDHTLSLDTLILDTPTRHTFSESYNSRLHCPPQSGS